MIKLLQKLVLAVFLFLLTFNITVANTNFSDLSEDTMYIDAIDYLLEEELLTGYPDGTFRPERLVNRAEYLNLLLKSFAIKTEDASEKCFPDVTLNEWYTNAVCTAKKLGVIEGFNDGNFQPERLVNLSEAAKMLVEIALIADLPLADVWEKIDESDSDNWFEPYLEILSNSGVDLADIKFYQQLKRQEIAYLLATILQADKDDYEFLELDFSVKACADGQTESQSPVPYEGELRTLWLDWFNAERAERGLDAYTYNSDLDRTAKNWSDIALQNGTITHKRSGQTSYYDYKIMQNWFSDQGVSFAKVGGTLFTENIGWGYAKCKEGQDCKQQFVSALRSIFDFYMSEEGKAYSPHFNSIVSKTFNQAGLGLAYDEASGKLYLTMHLGVMDTAESSCEL